MISFVCWKWNVQGANRAFLSHHVNVLLAMVERNYRAPFRFICITDDPAGLCDGIETMPMPVRFDHVPNPQGGRFPSCYCRLWAFSREATVLGERILSLDIDLIVTGDLRSLVDRDEDFVGWCDDPRFAQSKIAGGAYLLRTGSMPHIWEQFDPEKSPIEAAERGNQGSDQGWMSHKLYPPPGKFDGLCKINWTQEGARRPPRDARIVFTSGVKPPWSTE